MSLFWGGNVEIGIGRYDDNHHRGKPIIGYIMMAASILGFIIALSTGPSNNGAYFPSVFRFMPTETVFSSLLGNSVLSLLIEESMFVFPVGLFIFYVFADNVEYAMGHLRFTLFCLIAGSLALWMTYWFTAPLTTPLAGFTATLSVIIGAYMRIFPKVEFILYREASILDNKPLHSLFHPFARVPWARINIYVYVFAWYVTYACVSTIGTMNNLSVYLVYQLVGLTTGFALAKLFRNPHVAILDQGVTYDQHVTYMERESTEEAFHKKDFSHYKKSIDPTFKK